MNPQSIESAKDSDLRGAWAALQRASAAAERIALQTGTRLINVESSDTAKGQIRPQPKAGSSENP